MSPENTHTYPGLNLLVFGAFCGLTALGFLNPALLGPSVLLGLALPVIWAWRTHDWSPLGLSRDRLGPGLAWGLAGGILAAITATLVTPQPAIPTDLAGELLIGIPLWLLVASPYQELFFRGWLQPHLERAWGRWPGLLAATGLFTLWHYVLPLASGSSYPLATWGGLLGVLAAGLIYAISYQQARSVIAPWLAHALSGITFILLGAAGFLPG